MREDILHADEINCLYLFFIYEDFKLVKTIYPNDQTVFIVSHMLVVAFQDLLKENVFALLNCFKEYFIV